MKTRIEKDSMGKLEVPVNALYGAQTQRAINNFPISNQTMPKAFIEALILIKKSAGKTNFQLGHLSEDRAAAIVSACDELLKVDFMVHFPIDVYQTGSGTSTNMNANEVIANLANQHLQRNGNEVDEINANDHVNLGQSSNDVIPSTIHVSAMMQLNQALLPSLHHLVDVIENKASSVSDICKTGRTHLMDAMPVTFDQPLMGWASQLKSNIKNIEHAQERLRFLAQGGTAVGTGINADKDFATRFVNELSDITSIDFKAGNTLDSHFFSLIGSQDSIVALSGCLKTVAVTIMKIANDLRWMNSGPLSGLGEISLEALQPGSSIMPGKVNPVIPEAAAMVAAQVIGNDAAITIGGQSGNFELNVMLPMIANNILTSIDLLSNVSLLLADKSIATFTVNKDNLDDALSRNPILITALNPIIGYAKAAEIVKLAYQQERAIIDVAAENTSLSKAELSELLSPFALAKGNNRG